jgi:HKD family nuclease
MIISPFLSKSVIKDFNERSKKIKNSELTLITRSSELSKLKPEDCSNIDIYTLKDAVVDGETMISEEDSDIKKQDIHAKIYMLKKYSESCLYLGSLNASHNALFGNIEFMIKLYSRNRYLNLSVLKNNLFGEEEECPFQHSYLQNDEREIEDETNNALDRVIKEINRLNSKAIIKTNDNLYDITLSFPRFESEFSVTVSPLLSNKTAELSETILFEGMSLTQLSEFYKISVSNGDKTVRRVITIPTDNMPDEREKAVVSGIVNDKGSFNRYIAFLLGDNIVLSALETNEAFGEGSAKTDGTTRSQSDTLPSLYEKMLRTATTDPERFREIEYLLNTVDDDGVIPDGFKELYNTFKKVVKF